MVRNLLAVNKRVRAIGRNAGRLEPLSAAGAEPVVCDLADSKALAQAFAGVRAVYAMIPPDNAAANYRDRQRRVADALAAALKQARVPYAVMLSSLGANRAEGTGPIVGLHYLEQQLDRISGLNVLHLRAGYFMENLLAQVGIIKATGYAAGPLRADLPLPLIAADDIGAVAADTLIRLSFQGHQTRDLLGHRDLTMAEAAKIIGAAIGKPELEYQESSPTQAREAMLQMGLSPSVVDLILEMAAALNAGLVHATETRSASNSAPTSLETFVHQTFVPAYRGMASSG